MRVLGSASGHEPPPHTYTQGKPAQAWPACTVTQAARAAWAAALVAAAAATVIRKLLMAAGEHGEVSMEREAWREWH
eukprot:1142216-Pelagomonas_calceolata.AAC.6